MADTRPDTWIQGALRGGSTPEQIYLKLLGEGWTVAAIQEAFERVERAGSASDRRARVVRIVVGIGAVLVGAGVFSFVAANWQAMSSWARVAVIVATMLGFSGTGYWLRDVKGYRGTGEALLSIGTIAFGAGIFLVAQVFNLRGNWPDGFLMWAIGALAMALATRSTPLYAIGTVVALIPAFGYPFALFDQGSIDPYALTSPLLVTATAVVAIVAGLVVRGDRFDKDRW
jgi:uncharacterized membrane protein